jgi:hypothetical protein
MVSAPNPKLRSRTPNRNSPQRREDQQFRISDCELRIKLKKEFEMGNEVQIRNSKFVIRNSLAGDARVAFEKSHERFGS